MHMMRNLICERLPIDVFQMYAIIMYRLCFSASQSCDIGVSTQLKRVEDYSTQLCASASNDQHQLVRRTGHSDRRKRCYPCVPRQSRS